MVKAFIGESKERNRFRSDEACSSSLSSIVHDDVFIFRKDKTEIEVRRLGGREDRREAFKLARIKAPRAGGTKMVRCVDGMGSLLFTLTWFQIAN